MDVGPAPPVPALFRTILRRYRPYRMTGGGRFIARPCRVQAPRRAPRRRHDPGYGSRRCPQRDPRDGSHAERRDRGVLSRRWSSRPGDDREGRGGVLRRRHPSNPAMAEACAATSLGGSGRGDGEDGRARLRRPARPHVRRASTYGRPVTVFPACNYTGVRLRSQGGRDGLRIRRTLTREAACIISMTERVVRWEDLWF